MYASDWCFCAGLTSIPRVTYSHPDTEDTLRGFGLIADEAVDWSDFEAGDKLYEELDGMEEDFPF